MSSKSKCKVQNVRGITNENIDIEPVKLAPADEAKEKAEAVKSMEKQRDEKVDNARDHLVETLEVTADKYRTANGVMAALDAVRTVVGENSNIDYLGLISIAKTVAKSMANAAIDMKEKASALKVTEMDKLCEGFYDEDFASGDGSAEDMIHELMLLQLCQNVGSNAQDIKDFYESSNEEIDKAKREFIDFCSEHNLEFTDYVSFADCVIGA